MSVNDIIMSSQGNNINLLKQLPFYGKTIKPRIKEFTHAKLLSELPFFEKPIKTKIQQLRTKKLLSKQPFLPFYNDIIISRKKRAFKKYAQTYEVEIIDNKSLSDSLSASKNSIKNLFDGFLGEKRGFKYIISVKTTLKTN